MFYLVGHCYLIRLSGLILVQQPRGIKRAGIVGCSHVTPSNHGFFLLPDHWSGTTPLYTRFDLEPVIMANTSRTCSISRQDCATLYTFPGSSIPFTNSSCVPYTPWYSGDVGICGWVGAPCGTAETGSNCSVFRCRPGSYWKLTGRIQICAKQASALRVCVLAD